MEQKYQAHNLKVVGSNPTPAPKLINKIIDLHNLKKMCFWEYYCYKA